MIVEQLRLDRSVGPFFGDLHNYRILLAHGASPVLKTLGKDGGGPPRRPEEQRKGGGMGVGGRI